MKQSFLFLFFVCMSVFNGLAQGSTSLRLTQQYLMNHKWYPDIYEDDDRETSFITYSHTEEIDSTFTEEGTLERYIAKYYLSDNKDLVFDNSKVNNSVSGKYLITQRSSSNETNLTFIYEIMYMSEEKMVLKHLTEEYTTYGYMTTFYTAPFRE